MPSDRRCPVRIAAFFRRRRSGIWQDHGEEVVRHGRGKNVGP